MKRLFPAVGIFMFMLTASLSAQTVSFEYYYKFDRVSFDTVEVTDRAPDFRGPQMGGLEVTYPEAARKNGVEGTVKITAVLAADGKVHDIKIDQDLPFGVGAAVEKALLGFSFKPASVNGKPIPITMHLDYIVTLAYGEGDKEVSKPRITERPAPEYPSKYLAEKLDGKVSVQIMFRSDGTLKVVGVNSVMPREFDKAAAEAASKIKFEPAIHKKSKKSVSQQMTVEYEFKP
jgi:TonB family protein